MTYEPKQGPSWRSPEIRQRAGDGLWLVWLWRPLPMEVIMDADPWANAHAWARKLLERREKKMTERRERKQANG